MRPEHVNGLLWLVAAYYYARWLTVAVAAFRRAHRRARLAIVAFTGAWAAFALDRALVWLDLIPEHELHDWYASAVLAVAVACLRWVYLEFRAGRLPPRFPSEVER